MQGSRESHNFSDKFVRSNVNSALIIFNQSAIRKATLCIRRDKERKLLLESDPVRKAALSLGGEWGWGWAVKPLDDFWDLF